MIFQNLFNLYLWSLTIISIINLSNLPFSYLTNRLIWKWPPSSSHVREQAHFKWNKILWPTSINFAELSAKMLMSVSGAFHVLLLVLAGGKLQTFTALCYRLVWPAQYVFTQPNATTGSLDHSLSINPTETYSRNKPMLQTNKQCRRSSKKRWQYFYEIDFFLH